jgi:hypothetical protein
MDNASRVYIAKREAGEFRTEIRFRGWVVTVLIAALLGTLAYFDVPLRWMLVAAFVGAACLLIEIAAALGYRLDAGRSYLEMIVYDIEPVIQEISDQVRISRD